MSIHWPGFGKGILPIRVVLVGVFPEQPSTDMVSKCSLFFHEILAIERQHTASGYLTINGNISIDVAGGRV